MSGAAIASEVAAALAEAGAAVGDGPLIATITRQGASTGPAYDPTPGAVETFPVTVIDLNINVRDAAGTLTGEITRRLLVEATVTEPLKSDRITIRGVEHGILDVEKLAPGGVDLLYYVTIER